MPIAQRRKIEESLNASMDGKESIIKKVNRPVSLENIPNLSEEQE
jgi:hypothetical protein